MIMDRPAMIKNIIQIGIVSVLQEQQKLSMIMENIHILQAALKDMIRIMTTIKRMVTDFLIVEV